MRSDFTIKIDQLTREDVVHALSNLREEEWEYAAKFGISKRPENLANWYMGFEGYKCAVRIIEDPEFLVIGGFVPVKIGVWSSWYFATEYTWAHYPDICTVVAQERINDMVKRYGANRVETVCSASWTKAHRWYKHVGLTEEKTLPKFCADGSDAVMFVYETKGAERVLRQ